MGKWHQKAFVSVEKKGQTHALFFITHIFHELLEDPCRTRFCTVHTQELSVAQRSTGALHREALWRAVSTPRLAEASARAAPGRGHICSPSCLDSVQGSEQWPSASCGQPQGHGCSLCGDPCVSGPVAARVPSSQHRIPCWPRCSETVSGLHLLSHARQLHFMPVTTVVMMRTMCRLPGCFLKKNTVCIKIEILTVWSLES